MRFVEDFFSPSQASDWFQRLEFADWFQWQRETYPIYGRRVEAPRSIAWFGDENLNYRYTGIDHTTEGWPEPLRGLRRDVESASGSDSTFC